MTLYTQSKRLVHHVAKLGKACRSICLSLSILAYNTLPAHTSQLAIPASGAADAALAGTTVAFPQNVSSALFHNPAHLSLLPRSFSAGVLAFRFHPRYENNTSYLSTSRELPVGPNFGYLTDAFAPFTFAFGMYGSLGFMFNHMSDPANGVPNNFFTELVSISLAPSISYSLLPDLHIGISLNPTYGRLKFKTPSPVGRIDVDARGPGIFSTVGILYQPTPRLNLGLTYKTPGNIWMFGNARVNGAADDSTVSFKIPQNLKLGFAYYLTDRLTITGQGSWTEYSAFEETHLRFDKRSFLNTSAVADAKDRWRVGGGFEYEFLPGIKFRAGMAYEPWAIKDSALAPTLADTTDIIFPMGLSIEFRDWQIDFAGSLSHTETRRASRTENPNFAGRYGLDFTIFGLQVTRLLGSPAAPSGPGRNHDTVRNTYTSLSDTYATVSDRRAESVLDGLIARISADQCPDLTLHQPRLAIHTVGFFGSREASLAHKKAPLRSDTDGAAIDQLIARLASSKEFAQILARLDLRQSRAQTTLAKQTQ